MRFFFLRRRFFFGSILIGSVVVVMIGFHVDVRRLGTLRGGGQHGLSAAEGARGRGPEYGSKSEAVINRRSASVTTN